MKENQKLNLSRQHLRKIGTIVQSHPRELCGRESGSPPVFPTNNAFAKVAFVLNLVVAMGAFEYISSLQVAGLATDLVAKSDS